METTLDDFLGIKTRRMGDFSWVNPSTPLSSINLNWSEKELPERLRTKHVHRLHPYLGKFVPQLVEIFLRKFRPQVVLDPFCGSGTTLVEANVLGIDSIGCDVSEFNCLLCKVKTDKYNIHKLELEIKDILKRTSNENIYENIYEATPYLKEWYAPKALSQLLSYRSFIDEYEYSDVMKIILSRAARSSRLTTHFDLDFPKRPQKEPYYCHKHHRICKPADDALIFLKRYSLDTIKRIKEFMKFRTDANVTLICGDSRDIKFPEFDAVITSPPYVGLIDYHEQHRYAYELLNLQDNRDSEIGSSIKGNSKKAIEEYVKDITNVFINIRKSIKKNGVVVVVVNDKHNLFEDIANKVGFENEAVLTRNVNRRTGRRTKDFFEQVFIWRAI